MLYSGYQSAEVLASNSFDLKVEGSKVEIFNPFIEVNTPSTTYDIPVKSSSTPLGTYKFKVSDELDGVFGFTDFGIKREAVSSYALALACNPLNIINPTKSQSN